MDLPALRTVVAVADELHFGRAAQRLGIAQPQVSQRVRKLEEELGIRLFERDNHRVTVTDRGGTVIRYARETVASADRLDRLVRGLHDGSCGTVRIGAVGSAFFGALAELLRPCREQLPDLELQVNEMETPEQVDALAAGTLDIGFLRPPAPREVRVRQVWREPLVVALPDDSLLAVKESIARDDLAGQPVVMFPRAAGPGYWDRAAALLGDTGADVRPAATADNVTTMLGLVSLGVGLTIVPSSMQTVQLPGVTYRPLREEIALPLAVATARTDPSPATRRVLETIPTLRDG